MKQSKVGITGQSGFIGSALFRFLQNGNPLKMVRFERHFFEKNEFLEEFVEKCDVIVHLAGISRSADPDLLYRENMILAKKLYDAAWKKKGSLLLITGSTTHVRDTPYHRSKHDTCELFASLTEQDFRKVSAAALMPNTFGPGGKPFYNSVVSTFCCQLARGETPLIQNDARMELCYIDNLVRSLHEIILNRSTGEIRIPHDYEKTVSEVLDTLLKLKAGKPPSDSFSQDLKTTWEWYRKHYA